RIIVRPARRSTANTIPAIAADRRLRHRQASKAGALVLTTPQPSPQHVPPLAPQHASWLRTPRSKAISAASRWGREESATRSDLGDDADPGLVHRLEALSLLLRILVLDGADDVPRDQYRWLRPRRAEASPTSPSC